MFHLMLMEHTTIPCLTPQDTYKYLEVLQELNIERRQQKRGNQETFLWAEQECSPHIRIQSAEMVTNET